MQRRLAAVLAADIVGYSAMMGADEAATLETLRAFRAEVFGPVIAGRRGRIVKSMGDGWLVTFDSAVEAVNCAMQVQDRMAAHPTVKLRIGVHIGDVAEEADDIFGDGVNVAARLEAVASPGGVAISDPAYASLDGTLAPAFDDAGEMSLKNIARPLRVWTRAPRTAAAPPDAALSDRARAAKGFPRIAIRPVATSDGRAEIRELADALTSDIDAYLGAVRWLVTQVRDAPADGDYDLRMALRARGDRLRLEARLFAPDGAQLWSSKFDGDLAESFDWQDEVGERIASNLMAATLETERGRLDGLAPDAMTAEQCLLMGLMTFRSFAVDAFSGSLTWLKRAIDKDATLLDAHAEAIFIAVAGGTVGLRTQLAPFFEALPGWMAQARAFHGRSAVLDLAVAVATFVASGDTAPFNVAAREALRRAPFDIHVLSFAGWGFIWSGDPQSALACVSKLDRLGGFAPYAAGVFGCRAMAHLQLGDLDAAIDRAEDGLRIADGYPTFFAVLASAHAQRGEQAEAAEAMAQYLRLVPDRTVSGWRAFNDYGGSAGGQAFFEGLRRAGLPE